MTVPEQLATTLVMPWARAVRRQDVESDRAAGSRFAASLLGCPEHGWLSAQPDAKPLRGHPAVPSITVQVSQRTVRRPDHDIFELCRARINPCPSCGTKRQCPRDCEWHASVCILQVALPWLTDDGWNFQQHRSAAAKVPVLVDLGTVVQACRMVSPAVERMAAKYRLPGSGRQSQRGQLPGVPAVRHRWYPHPAVDPGRAVVDRLVGAFPEAQLDAFVQRGLG